MKVTLNQYQQIYSIPSGATEREYTNELLKIFNISDIKSVKSIKNTIDDITIPEVKELDKFTFKINGRKYGVVKDIMKDSYNAWMQYEAIVNTSPTEDDIIKNLHKILAIYIREKNIWGKVKSISKIDIEQGEKDMLDMPIDKALAANVFFYLNIMDFIKSTKMYYLNQRIRKSQIHLTQNK